MGAKALLYGGFIMGDNINLNQNKLQNLEKEKQFSIHRLPITAREKKGIFEAWAESSDL